jgi:hypothetical protein
VTGDTFPDSLDLGPSLDEEVRKAVRQSAYNAYVSFGNVLRSEREANVFADKIASA